MRIALEGVGLFEGVSMDVQGFDAFEDRFVKRTGGLAVREGSVR